MRKNTLLLAAALAAFGAARARATTIEGYTPSGNFQTVGVSDLGALFVDILSTTPQHVITDTGSVVEVSRVIAPVVVTGPAGGPVAVTATFSGTLAVGASTATTLTTGQLTVNTTPVQIYAASATRFQSTICNSDPVVIVRLGAAGVTAVTGLALPPGTCYSPDVPASFQGAMFAISTGTTVSGAVSFAAISP